jgi:hypothetical protein
MRSKSVEIAVLSGPRAGPENERVNRNVVIGILSSLPLSYPRPIESTDFTASQIFILHLYRQNMSTKWVTNCPFVGIGTLNGSTW